MATPTSVLSKSPPTAALSKAPTSILSKSRTQNLESPDRIGGNASPSTSPAQPDTSVLQSQTSTISNSPDGSSRRQRVSRRYSEANLTSKAQQRHRGGVDMAMTD